MFSSITLDTLINKTHCGVLLEARTYDFIEFFNRIDEEY